MTDSVDSPIPHDIERPIEADTTSDYASDTDTIGSDLTSIKSSVYHYQYENGRRYHAYRAGNYMLPNDEREQDRLDLMHHVFLLSLNGELCYSKLDNPLNILDIGTGTGIWAIEAGDLYPSARVIGTDVSRKHSSHQSAPDVWKTDLTNTARLDTTERLFQVDDATDPWAFPKNHFDLIHIRCLAGSIRDWPALIKRAYDHIRPGGKIEVSEARTHLCCDDGSYTTETQTYKWVDEFHRIAHSHGLEFDPFPYHAENLRQGGFKNVTAEERPCPIGSWPRDKKLKEIGKFFKHQFITGAVDSYSLALFTRMGGWSEIETQILLAGVRQEFEQKKFHVYTHCSYAVGEKPMST